MKITKKQQLIPTILFSTKLLPKASPFVLLELPKSAKLPSKGTTMVEGAINSLPFRLPFEPNNKGGHELKINQTMQDALGVAPGDDATVEITRVADEPEARVPVDLSKALATTPKSLESWSLMTPMARRDWIFSVATAIQPETRARRIEKARDMLSTGKRRLCCFPGIKWLMKKNEKTCGMWLPLADSKGRRGQ